MERHNRKSHLAPQLSPATQNLLRGSDSPTGDIARTPTSGEIPIGGGDVRSALISPREQVVNTINSARSPNLNGNGSFGRAGGAAFHPGLPRVATTNSIPKVQTVNAPDPGASGGASSAGMATFSHSLPIRPAPPAGPLPPPPVPKKEGSDLEKKENRRQATFGAPTNGYGGQY